MKLTKTQINCIEKSLIFEKPYKKSIQLNIDSYKCLKNYKVTYATLNHVILLKPIEMGMYHKVDVNITKMKPKKLSKRPQGSLGK